MRRRGERWRESLERLEACARKGTLRTFWRADMDAAMRSGDVEFEILFARPGSEDQAERAHGGGLPCIASDLVPPGRAFVMRPGFMMGAASIERVDGDAEDPYAFDTLEMKFQVRRVSYPLGSLYRQAAD